MEITPPLNQLVEIKCDVCHRTDRDTAEKILAGGFQPSRKPPQGDPPWYGEGAYFFKHEGAGDNAQKWAKHHTLKKSLSCSPAVLGAKFTSTEVFSIADQQSVHYQQFYKTLKEVEMQLALKGKARERHVVTFMTIERIKENDSSIEAVCYRDDAPSAEISDYHGLVVCREINARVSEVKLLP